MVDEEYIEEQQKGQEEFNEILSKLKAAVKEGLEVQDGEIFDIADLWNELVEKEDEYEGLWGQTDDLWSFLKSVLEEITRAKFGEVEDSELVFEDYSVWLDDKGYIHVGRYDPEEEE